MEYKDFLKLRTQDLIKVSAISLNEHKRIQRIASPKQEIKLKEYEDVLKEKS